MASSSPAPPPTATIKRAVKALQHWKSKQPISKNPKPTKKKDDFLYLIISLARTLPKGRTLTSTLLLPHAIFSPYDPDHRVCLLVDDKHCAASKKRVEEENLPVSNVVRLSRLRKEEDRERVCEGYDSYVTDCGLVERVERVVGRRLRRRRKEVVGVRLGKGGVWREEVGKVGRVVEVRVGGGSCVGVRVGRSGMEVEEIVENVERVVRGVGEEGGVVPGKWKGVKGLCLKFPESVAVPIWPEEKVLKVGKKGETGGAGEDEVGLKKRKRGEAEGEREEGLL